MFLLSFKAPTNQASLVFAAVFCGVWFGSAIVTLNAQLLGATMSFFQTVCVLGYCVFPLTISALGDWHIEIDVVQTMDVAGHFAGCRGFCLGDSGIVRLYWTVHCTRTTISSSLSSILLLHLSWMAHTIVLRKKSMALALHGQWKELYCTCMLRVKKHST